MENKITMIELFSGIGAQERALRQLNIPYEVKNTCDCDPNAVLSYAAMRWDIEKEMQTFEFPTQDKMIEELQAKNLGYDFKNSKHTITKRLSLTKLKQYYIADKLSKNLGDISKVEKLPYVDLIVHSSPCQSFSVAGKGAGGDEGSGTTSSLMWESLRLIATSKPKYILWENVANVLSDKHKHNFIKYLERLTELGYESSFDLLNSKHYGIPQNRLRIFCISRKVDNTDNITRNIDNIHKSSNKQVESIMNKIMNNPNIRIWMDYKFPETIPLTIRLKDVLEKNVDEKYYLSDEKVEKVLNSKIMQKENNEPFVVASRGRYADDSSTKQNLEPNFSGCTNTLTSVQKDNYVCEPSVDIIKEDIVFPVKIRKYNIDTDKLKYLLKLHKKYTNKEIAEKLHKPLTLVEHWFRQDECFAIPDENIWFSLKELLGITTDEFDDAITTFEIRDGVYDKSNRCYHINGIAPTLTAANGGEKIIEPMIEDIIPPPKKVGNLYPSSGQAGNIYDAECCAPCLPGFGAGGGGKELKVLIKNNIRWRIRKLTTKENWRLMGFKDKDHDRATQYVSSTTLYKQAGNSIVTNCLVALFSSFFIKDGYKADIWTKHKINYND